MQFDVVIVGGGLAGLTAAVGLGQSGLRVVVIEREGILGGRARSWIDEKTGDPVSIGPHIFLSEYPNTRKLLGILGTESRIVWQRDKFITIVDGRTEVDMKMVALPAPLHYAPSLLRDPRYDHRDRLSNLPVSLFALQLTEADIEALDDYNALAVLRSMGVTENFIRKFWSFTAMAIMNVPLELCSAGALFRFYRRLIGHRYYEVGFADGGLGDLFAPQAKARIEAQGGQVWLETDVAELTWDGRRATGARLRDGRQVTARHVIAALPPRALRDVCPPEWQKRTPFADLVYFQPSPYLSMYLWFDKKLTSQAFWAREHDPNDLCCDFYDLTNIHSGWSGRPSVICTNCIYAERAFGLSDEEVIARTVRELAEYLPEAAEAKLLHSRVHRIPMAIHCPYPGTEQRRAPARTPIEDLYLAGDWVKTGLPSSMEGACMAGWQAAEAVLAAEGRPRGLAVPHKPIEGLSRMVFEARRVLPLPRLVLRS